MSINHKLVSFAQKQLVLAHNDQERSRIKRSLDNLQFVLEEDLGDIIDHFVLFGSYTRNTILPRKYDVCSDIDLMVVFDTKNNHYAPNTYQKWILETLSKAYPKSIYRKSAPVVNLELNHIMFDIVPSYHTNNFFTGNSYYIPGKGNSWRSTVPNDLNDPLKVKNSNYGDNVIRNVIRLCKHWNASFGYPYQSYLLEKHIVGLTFWGNENTYHRFLKTLKSISNDMPNVQQAIEWVKEYDVRGDEEKQLKWLRKLLPGLY